MGKVIIIGGYFNTYLNPSLDKSGGSSESYSERKHFLTICEEFDLFDMYRFKNPTKRKYIWRNKGKPNLTQSRSDMFLISEQMQYQNITCNILPGILSDHSLVQLQFSQTTDWVRGRGFWKFNVDLLKDQEYITKVNFAFEEFKTTETTLNNNALSWDYIKCKL